MLKGFREFILRGSVVELAVAVAIGAAFTALIAQVGDSLVEPLVSVFLGGGVEGGTFTLRGVVFDIGALINAVIVFLTTAAVIYFLVVMPMNMLMARRKAEVPPDVLTVNCPECLSKIPAGARRCAFCTAAVPPTQSPSSA